MRHQSFKPKPSRSFKKNPPTPPKTPFYLYGIHPISEAIKKNYVFKKLYLQKNTSEATTPNPHWDPWIKYCQEKNIQFRFISKAELDQMMHKVKDVSNPNHQGVIAELKEGTRIIQDLTSFVKQADPANMVLIADHITDQQNLGAIARSSYYFNCSLIITENHHSAPIDGTVHKVSSGASLLIPFYQCEKISQAINILKDQGYHILASSLDQDSTPVRQINLTNQLNQPQQPEKIALIIGAEGEGVRPHLLRLSDQKICITGSNDFDSLNVSVATGILLYQLSLLFKK